MGGMQTQRRANSMPAIPLDIKTDPILNIAKHLDVASEDELVLRREHIALT
jgi:hypothetical protein